MRHPLLKLLPIIAISTDTTMYLTITTLWPLSLSLLCATITISLHQPTLYKWTVPIYPPGPMPSVVKPWHCNGAPPGAKGGGATVSFFSNWKPLLGSTGHVSDKVLLMQIKSLALPFAITCYLAKRIFYYNTAYLWQKFFKLAILIYIFLSFQLNPRCLFTTMKIIPLNLSSIVDISFLVGLDIYFWCWNIVTLTML